MKKRSKAEVERLMAVANALIETLKSEWKMVEASTQRRLANSGLNKEQQGEWLEIIKTHHFLKLI